MFLTTNSKVLNTKLEIKDYRFNVKDADKVKQTQSDINNFIRKFLNEDSIMKMPMLSWLSQVFIYSYEL